jgi:hypothetical protein
MAKQEPGAMAMLSTLPRRIIIGADGLLPNSIDWLTDWSFVISPALAD